MTDDHDPIRSLYDLLHVHAPELLPITRYLVLGPYLAEGLLGDHSRRPTVRELISLKRVVEQHRPTLGGTLARLLHASGQSPAVRVELQLDRLLELDPAQWRHASAVLPRPTAEAADLLEACRLRMEGAGDEARGRLEGVAGKLEVAVRIEDKARERRTSRGVKGAGKG